MAEFEKKEVCKCHNCGNEAEMVVTCTLPDAEQEGGEVKTVDPTPATQPEKRLKGTFTCTQCGNESDMWIDI